MANWKLVLNLSDLWQNSEARGASLTPQAMAAEIAKRLEQRIVPHYPEDFQLADVALEFEGLSEDEGADFDDLDSIYDRLCDWGDQGHRLWVKTF